MNTKPLNRVIIDIGGLTEIFHYLLTHSEPLRSASEKLTPLTLSDYTYEVMNSLLVFITSKDNNIYSWKNTALIDKLLFDLNDKRVSYQLTYDTIAALESWILRLLVQTIPEIDGEGIVVDSMTRLNERTISINVLKW